MFFFLSSTPSALLKWGRHIWSSPQVAKGVTLHNFEGFAGKWLLIYLQDIRGTAQLPTKSTTVSKKSTFYHLKHFRVRWQNKHWKLSFSKDAFGYTCLNLIQNNLSNKHPLSPKIPNKDQPTPFFNFFFHFWGMSWLLCEAQTWFGGVFGVIKDQDIAGGSFGGNDAGVLGHVPGSVHLSLVVYLDFNLNFSTYWAKASKL